MSMRRHQSRRSFVSAYRRRCVSRFVVEPLEARELLSTLLVTDTTDSSGDTGSLRYAIAHALGGDTIHFNIPTTDPGYSASTGSWTISSASVLSVNTSIVIDGTSQPGFTPGGHPVIVLSRPTSAGGNIDGLVLNADGCTVEGLVINSFIRGAGLRIASSNNTVQGNYSVAMSPVP